MQAICSTSIKVELGLTGICSSSSSFCKTFPSSLAEQGLLHFLTYSTISSAIFLFVNYFVNYLCSAYLPAFRHKKIDQSYQYFAHWLSKAGDILPISVWSAVYKYVIQCLANFAKIVSSTLSLIF